MRPEAQKQQTVANSRIKTSAVEGVLKIMEASPLKRPAPLHEKQPDEKRSKVIEQLCIRSPLLQSMLLMEWSMNLLLLESMKN